MSLATPVTDPVAIAQLMARNAGVGVAALVAPENPAQALRLYYGGGGRPDHLARTLVFALDRSVRMSDFKSLPWWNPDHQRLVWLTAGPRPVTLCPAGLHIEGGRPAHFLPTTAEIRVHRATWSFYGRPS